MSRTFNAAHTHKTILLALAEGWRLRCVDSHGWCLFQVGRDRPFAHVDQDFIQTMTTKGWLTQGFMNPELAQSFEKILTPLGRRCARHLIETGWARTGQQNQHAIAGKIDPLSAPSRRPGRDTLGLQAWGISA